MRPRLPIACLTCVPCLAAAIACGDADTLARDGAVPSPASACDEARARSATASLDLEVADRDRFAYPPYASAACTLVYVAASGDLLERDLGSSVERVLAPATERPRRPTVTAEVVAWEADREGLPIVRVLRRSDGTTSAVEGPFVAAAEPRASGASVAFTGFTRGAASPAAMPSSDPAALDGDSDVWLHDVASGRSTLALGGPGQQRFADLSGALLAVTDFVEDPDGRFDGNETDLADVVVLERASGRIARRALPGKQAFPMVDGDRVAFLQWGEIHPEPKLSLFELRIGGAFGDPSADRTVARVESVRPAVRPVVSGGVLEWVASPSGESRLWRAPADGAEPPRVAAELGDGLVLAPSPGGGFTLVASTAGDLASGAVRPRLRAVAR